MMKKPADYEGPQHFGVPYTYLDVTSFSDRNRRGIAGPNHPYYLTLKKITDTIKSNVGLSPDALAEKIMEVL